MVWFLVVILVLFGGACVGLPHAFTKRPDTIRLSVGGVIVYLLALVFSMLPQGLKVVLVRAFGGLMLLLAAFVGVEGGRPGTFLHKPASNVPAGLGGDVTMDERAMIAAQGPEYTAKVLEGVKAAHPDWIVESPGLMQVTVTDGKSLNRTQWTFEHALHNGTPAEERVRLIVEGSPKAFGMEREYLAKEGKLESEIASRRTQYAAQLAAMNASAPAAAAPAAAPAAAAGTLEDAARHIAAASAAWRSANPQGAVDHATKALEIRRTHLGAGHPQVVEVERMLAAAQAQLAQQPR